MKYKVGDYLYDIEHKKILGRITKIFLDYNMTLKVEFDADWHIPFNFTYDYIANDSTLRLATKTEILLYVKS